MRRLLALALLLCFAWTQASATDCPLEGASAPEGAHAAVHDAPHDAHAAHGHHAPAPEDGRGAPPHHADGPCPMVSACGVVALPSAGAALTAPGPIAAPALFPPAGAYTSPHLGSDPPPPRPL